MPFSSSRKRMSVIVKRDEGNVLLIKGASEILLNQCNQWYNPLTNKI